MRICSQLLFSFLSYGSILCLAGNQVVSDHQFQLLSVEIAPKWRNVAHCLKPEPMHGQKLDDIAIQHPDNLQEQAICMLEAWRDKYGHTASIKTLCEVLINADYRATAEKVFGRTIVEQVYSQMRGTDTQGLTVWECCLTCFQRFVLAEPTAALYTLAEEVGTDWKPVAVYMRLSSRQIKLIELEAQIPRQQAFNMLCHLHSKMGSCFNIDEVQRQLQQIRNKKQEVELKSKLQSSYLTVLIIFITDVVILDQIFPQNIRDDVRLCGRQTELDAISETFWESKLDKQKCQEIPEFCLQVITLTIEQDYIQTL